MSGVFVTFEGPEGCGKSTQAALLAERLRAEAGVDVLTTREPGGTPTGELIRGVLQNHASGEDIGPECEVLLFAASRAHLVRSVIRPALDAGRWVVCDRFADSTTVYQGYGRGFSMDALARINGFAMGGAVPDVTFLLDVDLDTGLARMRSRNRAQSVGEDRIEQEGRPFHERVRAGYLDLASRETERFKIIDGTRDEQAVHADVWAVVTELLETHA